MLSHRTEVKSSAPSRAQRLAHTGDLFYQTVRPYQKNNYLFEKPDNNYVFSTGYAQMRPYVDGYFLLSLVQSERFVKVVLDNCTGTSYPAINANDLAEIEVAAPSDESEAQKIGTIFRSIDNLITLHQRQPFLHSTPEISLTVQLIHPFYTSSWEQRKLGELVDVCSGRDYKHLSEGTIPVYGTGGYMLSVNDALSYDRDAIGIGRKGTIDRPYILKAPFWTVDTLFYAIPREKVDLNYAFDIFQNIDWKKKDESTGVPSLSKTAINDIDVLAPKHDEQQIIGQFFAAIDNLITLHQRKPFLMKWRTSDANRNKTNRLVL